MASLLNNASLLLNPAGSIIAYEEDKIFSVLPSNGTGDFTFSGGDGGTRVNQDGYIEQVPRNLITDSADFGYWTKDDSLTRTDNQPDPFGTNTAAKFSNNLPGGAPNNAYIYKSVNYIAGATYTFSLYIKGDSAGSITLRYDDSTTGPQYVVNYTTEWQRFSVTRTVNSTSGIFVLGGYSAWTPGENLTVAFAQHELYSTPRPYQPTTDRLNYPRITYQNGRGALLSEPQRTNVNTYSQAIVAANGYNVDGCSLTANNAISPDGTQNATLFVESANSNYHRYYKYGTGTASTKVWTIFAKYKPGGREWLTMDAGPLVYFNIANGTLGNTSSDIITQIEPYKDGWYRCTYIDPTSAVDLCFIGAATYNGDPGNYAGDGRDCFWVWGMQCEDSVLFPTSYIPTTSATVTRPGDVTTKTGASSVINASEGTIYVDFVFGDNDTGGSDQNLTMLYSGGYSNSVFFACYGSTIKKLYGWITNGATQVAIQSPTLYKGQRVKAALTYKNNDYIMYVNGVSAGTQAQPVPSLDTIIVGSQVGGAAQAPNPLATTALFNTRLTNTQLAELTTVRSGSGGNISYYGPYTIHTFTGSATFTPSFTGPVEVLVVAGGGSAGSAQYHSGGGGAGGLLYVSSYGVSQGTGITVTIGAGGAAPTTSITRGNNGSNSVFGGLTAIGGGGGGTYSNATGLNGGSGGGGGAQNGVFGAGGLGIIGQGSNGGDYNGDAISNKNSGGGGGAGQSGQTGTGIPSGGNGGNGLPYSISGFSTYYAGGGGGSTEVAGLFTTGGLGGGGNGNYDTGQNGVSGLGGGGGAGERYGVATTGAGGSGIVIVRYLT
jgi:hypothetical protein